MKKLLLSGILSFSVFLAFAQGASCPYIDAGVNQTLPCTQACTNLTASLLDVGETTSYAVSAIPHAPPIPYGAGGGTAVSVNTDDVWSNVINLPFPFCFYGATYNSCIIGSNGAINFNTASAGGYHPWPFNASVPSAALTGAGNIFTPYHDIDPSEGGSVKWYLTGVAPCRIFVVSFNNIPHYDCTNVRSTHMVVLYETTNIIEVFVNNKSTCGGWNGGNTVIGIQNLTGTAGLSPPGRNTGNWGVGTPEAWRFKPTGTPIYSTVEWYNGPTLIGTGATINVCPSPPQTTYTARTTYTRCDGFQIIEQDNVTVFYDAVTVNVSPQATFTCAGASTTLTATSPTATNYLWTPGGMTTPTITVSPLTTTTYTCTATNSANGCSETASATITIAQPISSSCNVLYVSPTGTATAAGSKTDPMDLFTALEKGACNGTIVKMAIGTYNTDTTIQRVTSYITLEGGFDPAVNWEKTSAAGATRILRSATQTTSLVSGNGIDNEAGTNPEVVAISVANQSGFRFQDLTIEVLGLGGGTTYSGYNGVDVIGTKLVNCNAYNFVRTRVIAGSASNGAASIWSIPATNGGNSTGVELISNGANGNLINCTVQAGPGGTGGAGGGSNGTSNAVTITGTALVTNDNNFNLAAQPVIRMDDVSCTATNMDFTGPISYLWNFDSGSTPGTATGASVATQYSNLGRKTIAYGANNYVGFANIILDSQVNPAFTTSAPFVQGQYRVCAGTQVDFTATNGGIGYVYHWDLGGGATGQNSFDGTSFDAVSGVFNTPGIYVIDLSYETNCCGVSSSTTLNLYVEEQPVIGMPTDEDICLGDFGGATLTITGFIPEGTIWWSPTNGLNTSDSTTVVSLPSTTTTYAATITDSTGICSSTGNVTVNVTDLQLTTSSTAANCITLGTASVVVANGSGNYSYLWSNAAGNTSTVGGLQPGTYTVYVTDNILSCVDSAQVSVLPGAGALTATMSTTDILCAGDNNGAAFVSVSGGTPPYTYAWSPVGGTTTSSNLVDSITNLSQGTYTVTITDYIGCNFVISDDVMESSPIVFVVDSAGGPTCSGVTDGYIEISTDGGERPYNFSWSNGMPAVVINDAVVATNLDAGTYVLTVVDDFACSDSISITLNAPPIISTTTDTTICYGASFTFPNGAISILTADSTNIDSLVTSFGCDSIVTTNVTVPALIVGVFDTTICNGGSFVYNGTSYSAANLTGTETLTALNGCDSIVTVTVTQLAPFLSNLDTTICNGDSFSYNGTTYGNGNLSGIDTFSSVFGCDSIHTINVTELSLVLVNIDTIICQGETLSVNGINYTASGIYNDTVFYTQSGCDSIQYVIDLKIDSFIVVNIDTTICQGQSLTVNGTTYTASGLYNDTAFYAQSGCDSTQYVVNLSIDSFIVENIDTVLCQGQTLTVNGTTYAASGLYNDTAFYAQSGCDSIQYVINLSIDSFILTAIDTTICQGQTLTINGITYSTSGSYNDTAFYTQSGCDSIQYLINLVVNDVTETTIDTVICQGQTLTVNGVTYTASGVYNDTVTYALNGCDSIRYAINLTVDSFTITTIDTTICQGQNLTINGVTYTASGAYNDTAFYTQSGCDSVQYVINLGIDSFVVENIDTTLCQGQSLTVNGTTYTASGLYNDTAFYAQSGCDSIQYVINLSIDSFIVENIDTVLCQGQTLTVNGTTYAASGLYNDTAFYAQSGCDSIQYVINLSIDSFILTAIDTTICQGQTLTINGITYSTSGSYNDTAFYTQSGCDSIQYLINLVVNDVTETTIDTAICQGQTLTVNGVTYTASGVYNDTVTYALNGCDSIRYAINLTVDSFTITTIDTTICQGQNLTINGVTYTASGVYNDTAFYTQSGCDSIQYVIDLKIDSFIVVNIDTTICQGQTLTVNGVSYTASGLYSDAVPHTQSACDSIQYIINLAIDSFVVTTVDTVICQGESIVVNGVVYSATGMYADTNFYAIGGCIQEIYNVNLTVAPIPTVQATSSELDSTACVNELITLIGTGSPGNTYSWNNGVLDNVSFNPVLGQTTYIVTATDANACVNADTITITGHPIYASTVNVSICEDENYVLPDGSVVNTAGVYPVTLNTVNGCDSVITTNLNVNFLGVFTPLVDVVVCSGLAQELSVGAQNMTNIEWFVNDGFGNQSLVGNPEYLNANGDPLSFNLDLALHQNEYTVQMTDECGNVYSSSMTLEVYEPHQVLDPVADTTFCNHELDVITVDYNGTNYVWNTGDIGASIFPDVSGEYIVNFIENGTNCEMSDTIIVTIEDCIGNCVVLAPTGFSPNESGMNDLFRVVTTCEEGFSSFTFSVYNRWGEVVYVTTDWRAGWDGTYKGKNAEIGTYTYYVEYTKELSNQKESLSGNVTLIR